MAEKITRARASELGLKRYFNGLSCPHGHMAERFVSDRSCTKCRREGWKEWAKTDVGAKSVSRRKRNWAEKNLDQVLLNQAKAKAARLGLPFDLTRGDCAVPELCPVFGVKLTMGVGYAGPNSPTLDRLDPAKGYVKGNVAVISQFANNVKGHGTAAQHRRIADWMESVSS